MRPSWERKLRFTTRPRSCNAASALNATIAHTPAIPITFHASQAYGKRAILLPICTPQHHATIPQHLGLFLAAKRTFSVPGPITVWSGGMRAKDESRLR
jgi:hypothetical protein